MKSLIALLSLTSVCGMNAMNKQKEFKSANKQRQNVNQTFDTMVSQLRTMANDKNASVAAFAAFYSQVQTEATKKDNQTVLSALPGIKEQYQNQHSPKKETRKALKALK